MVRKRSGDVNIPLDLIVEILKKLPAKSLARFRCVSYQWQSIINTFIVIDSIVTRCLSQPPCDPPFIFHKLLKSRSFSIFSYAHFSRQITNDEQLYHEEIFGKSKLYSGRFQYVRGLIGFWCSKCQFTIHNPTTRQYLPLPITHLPIRGLVYLFGYDPFKNQYKVLCLTKQSCKVFILGDPSKQWRDIECNIVSRHSFLFREVVCINGTIYYTAGTSHGSYFVGSFDISSEKFNHIQAPENLPMDRVDGYWTLLNYQGKLGCISQDNNLNDVDLWVMENAEKQEWSKITYSKLQGVPYPSQVSLILMVKSLWSVHTILVT